MACLGSPAFITSLLWYGWLSRPHIPWVVPLLASIPFGFAYQIIMTSMMNYVTDSYRTYAASAMAACIATRSITGAVLPLAIEAMLDRLGIHWTCTLLAILGSFLGLVPFIFIIFGPRLRQSSKFGLRVKRSDEGTQQNNSSNSSEPALQSAVGSSTIESRTV